MEHTSERPQAEATSEFLAARVTTQWLLRSALGVVYLWFGALKLIGMSPVLELIRRTYPPLATLPLYIGLALFEVALGLLLLFAWWKRGAAAAAILHLLGTFGVLVSAPHTVFLPRFPFLTLEGEFVVKNLVLLSAAAVLWFESGRRQDRHLPRPRALALLLILAVGLGVAVGNLHQSLRAAAQRAASPPGEARTTATAIGALTGNGRTILVVQGVIVDRCRLLGCWLKVRDQTGDLFVDLAPDRLTARGMAIGNRVEVAGHIGKTREGGVGFVASSIKPLRQAE